MPGFRDANSAQRQAPPQQRQAPPQGRQQPTAAPPRGRAPQQAQQRQAPAPRGRAPQQQQQQYDDQQGYDDGQGGDQGYDDGQGGYDEPAPAPQQGGFGRGRAQAPQGRQQPQGRQGGYQAPQGRGRAPAPSRQAPQRGEGRFAGVRANEPQHPTLGVGNFLVQFVSDKVTAGSGPEYYNATLLVLESDCEENPVGSYACFLQGLSGDQFRMGAPRMKQMAVAMLGFESEDDFNMQFPPDGRSVLNAMYEMNGAEYLGGEGAYVRTYPTNNINQKTGLPFNDYDWSICDPSILPPLAA